MRLIDADIFEAFWVNIPKEVDSDDYMGGVEYVIKKIDEAPTIDAVEVVRCKYCKHSEEALLPDQELWCNVKETYCTYDWFCADGKKRDIEDECSVCKYRNKRDPSKDTPYCLHCNVRIMSGEENELGDS